jgi:transcriptional regulator with XRE-family HTH domain
VSILKISIRQIKAARSLLGWSQDDLAEHSGVSKPTIGRLESIDSNEPIGGRPETGAALVGALEKAGVEFIAENGGGAGVRLKKRTNKR